MIIVTGAAGFIGSCLIAKLNQEGFNDIIAVDAFNSIEKNKNLEGKKITGRVERARFFNWLESNHRMVEFIFHIGARTDTTEFDENILNELNLNYTKNIWKHCVKFGIPLVYASSAATYGNGENGYDDDQSIIPALKPLNPYGVSKNEFDKWALNETEKPYFWIGLKFFNVYGPNEYHKGRMASVIFHSFNQVLEKGKINLFRSHRSDYANGEQKRDFVYVRDVTGLLFFLLHNRKKEFNGIYNLGTGNAESFNTLANSVFKALNKEAVIEYIDIPEDIRGKYQYFTEAKMDKLKSIGYNKPFTSLEKGIEDYVTNYLLSSKRK